MLTRYSKSHRSRWTPCGEMCNGKNFVGRFRDCVCLAPLTSPPHSRGAVHQWHARLSTRQPHSFSTISAPPLTPLSSRLNALGHSSLPLSLSVAVPPLCRCLSVAAELDCCGVVCSGLTEHSTEASVLRVTCTCGSVARDDCHGSPVSDPFLMPSSRRPHHPRPRLGPPHLAPLLSKLSAAAVTESRARTFSCCLLPVSLPAPPANCCCCCHSCSHAQPLLDPDVFHKSTSVVVTVVRHCYEQV